MTQDREKGVKDKDKRQWCEEGSAAPNNKIE